MQADAIESDPLVERLIASCEQRRRCACHREEVDCSSYALVRAAELREHAAEEGAFLDEECARAQRDLFDALCRDGAGFSYDDELLELHGAAARCELFHGDIGPGEPCTPLPTDYLLPYRDDCGEWLACGGDEPVCWEVPRQDEGAVCKELDVVGSCLPDLVCVPISAEYSLCERPHHAGDPCGGWQQDTCLGPPGLYCDEVTSLCQALPIEGEPCLPPGGRTPRCHIDHGCIDEVCRLRPGLGEPCDGSCRMGLDCEDGVCVGDVVVCTTFL